MNDMDRFNQQYRRPKPHFSDEKAEIRPTIDRRRLLTGSAMLAGLMLLLIVALVPKSTVDDPVPPEAAQVRSDTQQTTNADCQLIQHMTYAPCGHELTRRQVIPAELAGKNRETVSAAYDAWTITSFASAEVVMEQTLSLYCPEHVVLMPDEGGMLCVFQNKYGDALALVKELDLLLTELPDDAQQAVRTGKGFATIEELEQWLEGVES
ncbi:MAG: hypothetical protein ACI4ME_12000 [Aristaeellaceae bacterium]